MGGEIRELRRAADLTQRQLAAAAGVSREQLSRLERGRLQRFDLRLLAALLALLGHELSVRSFPIGEPIRDRAQLTLLARLDVRLHVTWRRTREASLGIQGDLRAWDELLEGPVRIGVEAETVLADLQDLQRRIARKQRDGGVDRVILLVADTRHNRAVLRDHLAALRATFPLSTREVLSALAYGRDPGGSGLVVLDRCARQLA